MTAILTQPQDKREKLPGVRDMVQAKVVTRLNFLHNKGKFEWPEQRSTIRLWIEGLDPDDFYRQAPFADLILDPPLNRSMDSLYRYQQRLDREMTPKAVNEWVNGLIAAATKHLYPESNPFWLE